MTTPGGATLLDETRYELTLVVSGASDLSTQAIANARRLCDTISNGRCHLSVVELQEHPAGAFFDGQTVAAPTLVKNWPLPRREFVGDLSKIDEALLVLGLPAGNEVPTPSETG